MKIYYTNLRTLVKTECTKFDIDFSKYGYFRGCARRFRMLYIDSSLFLCNRSTEVKFGNMQKK